MISNVPFSLVGLAPLAGGRVVCSAPDHQMGSPLFDSKDIRRLSIVKRRAN